jgi:hypothetical protein
MYPRRTQRRRTDGSVVAYVQLAHNRRVGGVTRAEVLLNLGREDELDVEGLRRLARSITRYTDGAPADASEAAGEGLEVVESRPLGGAFVLDALWRRLGVAEAIAAASARAGSRPMSSGCCSRWSRTGRWRRARSSPPPSGPAATRTSPALSGWTRTRPTGRWTCSPPPTPRRACRRRSSSAAPTCSTSRSTLLFFDTSSTYFERDEPEAGDGGEPGFRSLGHSKDHRPDLPQVVIGLAVTREGIPVRAWVWPGNTNDQTSRRDSRAIRARLGNLPGEFGYDKRLTGRAGAVRRTARGA